MKKYVKLVPTMVMAMVAAVGCGEKPEPAGPEYRNELQQAIAELPDGELTEKDVAGVFSPTVLGSGDSELTFSSLLEHAYSPRSNWYDSSESKLEEGQVSEIDRIRTFKHYDNDVFEFGDDYTEYAYDKTQKVVKDNSVENDSFSWVPSKHKDLTTVWDDGSNLNYVYDRNESSSNPFSFKASKESDEETKSLAASSGGVSGMLITDKDTVVENFEYYSDPTGWGDSPIKVYEDKTIVKDGSKLQYDYLGRVAMFNGLYSCEAVGWGANYAGYYVEMGYSMYSSISIEDAVVTNAEFGFTGIYRIMYKDLNWKSGDPTPAEDLTDEYIATLNLVIPDQVPSSGTGTIKYEANPYPTAKEYMSIYGNAIDRIICSNKKIGEYDTSLLPDPSGYRAHNFIDRGSSEFTVEEFLGEED